MGPCVRTRTKVSPQFHLALPPSLPAPRSWKQLEFQEWLLPKLDALPDSVLERYAWFATHSRDMKAERRASLMHKDGNLTKLGRYYRGENV